MKKIASFILLILFFLNTQINVFASIAINEVYPNPQDGEKEWIEIFNNSLESIDLSGWILMDQLSSPSIIYKFNQEKIEKMGYLIVELASNKLNNFGDTVKLLNTNKEIISQLQYDNSQTGMSFSLIDDKQENSIISLTIPTKGKINTVPNSTSKNYNNVTISNALACPKENEHEWLEIKNPNNYSVDLKNWQIKDRANNKIILSQPISSNSTMRLTLNKNLLNNSGDLISLFDSNSKLINQLEITSCQNKKELTSVSSNKTQSSNPPDDNKKESIITNNENSKPRSFMETKKNNMTDININNLKQVNKLLVISDINKIVKIENNRKINKMINIKHKNLSKSSIINIVIGGAVLTSSAVVFIKL